MFMAQHKNLLLEIRPRDCGMLEGPRLRTEVQIIVILTSLWPGSFRTVRMGIPLAESQDFPVQCQCESSEY